MTRLEWRRSCACPTAAPRADLRPRPAPPSPRSCGAPRLAPSPRARRRASWRAGASARGRSRDRAPRLAARLRAFRGARSFGVEDDVLARLARARGRRRGGNPQRQEREHDQPALVADPQHAFPPHSDVVRRWTVVGSPAHRPGWRAPYRTSRGGGGFERARPRRCKIVARGACVVAVTAPGGATDRRPTAVRAPRPLLTFGPPVPTPRPSGALACRHARDRPSRSVCTTRDTSTTHAASRSSRG